MTATQTQTRPDHRPGLGTGRRLLILKSGGYEYGLDANLVAGIASSRHTRATAESECDVVRLAELTGVTEAEYPAWIRLAGERVYNVVADSVAGWTTVEKAEYFTRSDLAPARLPALVSGVALIGQRLIFVLDQRQMNINAGDTSVSDKIESSCAFDSSFQQTSDPVLVTFYPDVVINHHRPVLYGISSAWVVEIIACPKFWSILGSGGVWTDLIIWQNRPVPVFWPGRVIAPGESSVSPRYAIIHRLPTHGGIIAIPTTKVVQTRTGGMLDGGCIRSPVADFAPTVQSVETEDFTLLFLDLNNVRSYAVATG